MFNSFGLVYKFTTWGESHGPAIGVVIDGVPSGFKLNLQAIQKELNRRKENAPRPEPDVFELQSGMHNDLTTGAPLSFIIKNTASKPEDYKELEKIFRPGHADYTYYKKYGALLPGGGRSSGRETACRVIAGSIAKQFLKKEGISITGKVLNLKENIRKKITNDSFGGKIEITAKGVPVGLGEPIYEKLSARLAYAAFSIGAVKAFELGSGVAVANLTGFQNNDQMSSEGFKSNRCGGVLGGISNGEDIVMRLSIKPVPSILQEQNTVDIYGKEVKLSVKGRHDRFLPPRILPVAESMMACVIFDLLLLSKMR